MERYTYSFLPADTIRVLHLHPGEPDSPLTGSLEHYSLPRPAFEANATGPNFVADLPASNYDCLSYVWGGDDKPSAISIAGAPLPITATLDSLLRRLRKLVQQEFESESESPSEDNGVLRLWADGICINQDDPDEKGAQVALMPVIYRAARRVVVDLGEESEDLDDALYLMSTWYKKHIWGGVSGGTDLRRPFTAEEAARLMGFDPPDPSQRAAFEAAELPDDTDPRWDAVARFFCRPWFERVWVVQEFVLARDVLMLCGEREIPWREVVAANQDTVGGGMTVRAGWGMSLFPRLSFMLMAYQRQVRVLQRTAEGREFLRIRKDTWLDTPGGHYAMDLYSMLELYQGSKATRRRDKYFALAGLAEDVTGDERELRPDYVSPIETVTSRVGRWLWKNGYGPDNLLTGGIWAQPAMRIPSWARDFTGGANVLDRSSIILQHYDAAKGTRFHATLTPRIEHLITVRGMFVDAVAQDSFTPLPLLDLLRQPSDGSSDDGKSYRLLLLRHLAFNLKAVLGDVASNTFPIPLELSDEALTSAFLFGCEGRPGDLGPRERAIGFRWTAWLAAHRHSVSSTADAPFDEHYRMLEEEFGADENEADECQDKFIDLFIAAAMRNGQLTRTRRGRVASLPSCFKKGDEVCIVQGIQLPLLLRRSKEYPGCYQLVGSCYAHGIMHGEALELGYEFEQVTLC